MDERAYQDAAAACLERVTRWLEPHEDLDLGLRDGMVSIEFEDGARFVLNRQSAAHQMWLAAGARAWHYGWDAKDDTWRDDRDAHELWSRLAEVVSEKLGRNLGTP